MRKEYYRLPLDFNRFFEEGDGLLDKCTEIESIDQHIEMLFTTCPGEHRFDPDFGCRIWDLDFLAIASFETWEKQFKQYIQDAIIRYEPRIGDLSLDIRLRDIVKEERTNCSVAVRKRADIYIAARVVSTDLPVKLKYSLYLGPLSNE